MGLWLLPGVLLSTGRTTARCASGLPKRSRAQWRSHFVASGTKPAKRAGNCAATDASFEDFDPPKAVINAKAVDLD
jgi:hypothetical protein